MIKLKWLSGYFLYKPCVGIKTMFLQASWWKFN